MVRTFSLSDTRVRVKAVSSVRLPDSGIQDRVAFSAYPIKTCIFLPQKPYCATGSLRDQLLYPSTADDSEDPQKYRSQGHGESRAHILRQSFSDEDLLGILRAVDLAELPERAGNGDAIQGLNAVLDWSNTLSLGEQQRLAFGRILVNRPQVVLMDESTSALDVESESRMYSLLKDMARRNGESSPAALTYISVGHRPTLLAHHHTKLTLKGEHCTVEPITNRFNIITEH